MGTLLRVDPAGGCFTVAGRRRPSSAARSRADGHGARRRRRPPTTRSTRRRRRAPAATTAGADDDHGRVGRGLPDHRAATTSGSTTRSCRSPVARERRPGRSPAASSARRRGDARQRRHRDRAGERLVRRRSPASPAGSQNLKVTYRARTAPTRRHDAARPSRPTCRSRPSRSATGRSPGRPAARPRHRRGWVTLPAPPAQPQAVGSTEVSSTWTLPGSAATYIGTGTYEGQVRVLVHTQRWTARRPTPFSTWGNFMRLVYDAP